MDCYCIPHTQMSGSSRLFTDSLYDFARVSEFYSFNPFDEESFRRAAAAIPRDAVFRRQMVAVLREQNERFSPPEAALDNLRKLEDPNTVAVVTGHQVGLFGGPAFALYKSLTAVKLARSLTDRGLPAVPIFWLATEDHDFEEVNHCWVQDREGNPRRLVYTGKPPIANAPAGSIEMTEAILPLIEELRASLPESASATALIENLSEFYRPGVTFGEAFARLLSRMFAEFGAVTVDPRDARIHQLTSPIFRAAIESAPALALDLLERNRLLASRDYHAQVHVTEDFSLLFVHVNGERRALRLRDGRFVTAQGDSYSTKDLLARLEQEPQTISANVLLRPVMQDALLPTVAYIGGPSETAYFAQAGAVYQRILGRMPVVFPRASLTLLDGVASRLLGKYELALPDLFAGKQPLRDKMAARFLPPGLTEAFHRAAANLESDFQVIQSALGDLDPTLVDAAANSGRKMQHQLSSLEQKAAAAVQRRSEQIERDAVRLENSLYPQKTPQERFYGGIHFVGRYGTGFLKQIYDQIPLRSAQHQVLGL